MNNAIFTTQEYVIFTTQNDDKFYCTQAQADVLKTLESTANGGLARLEGYVAKTGRITPETSDRTIITRFKTRRFYARKIEAMESLTFAQVEAIIEADKKADNPQFAKLHNANNLQQVFENRKEWEISRMVDSNAGTLSNAHVEAHKRNYIQICDGVKVNLMTEKVDGKQMPVATREGLFTANTILLNGLSFNKVATVKGTYKTVNNGEKVLMSKAFSKILRNDKVFKSIYAFATFRLSADNFTRLKISKNEIVPSHLEDLVY